MGQEYYATCVIGKTGDFLVVVRILQRIICRFFGSSEEMILLNSLNAQELAYQNNVSRLLFQFLDRCS
jgi:hypothetical protein